MQFYKRCCQVKHHCILYKDNVAAAAAAAAVSCTVTSDPTLPGFCRAAE